MKLKSKIVPDWKVAPDFNSWWNRIRFGDFAPEIQGKLKMVDFCDRKPVEYVEEIHIGIDAAGNLVETVNLKRIV